MADQQASHFELTEESLRRLVPDGIDRNLPKNTLVICEGDYSDSLYVVLSGRVKIFMSDEKGREVVLNTIGPGDYFGEFVLDGGPRTASVETMESTRLFVISRLAIEELLKHNPEFSRDLISRLITKVRSLTSKVRGFALSDVYGRLRVYINENIVRDSEIAMLRERVTHQDIALRIGASREVVSRILKDLSDGGYIAMSPEKRIIVNKKLPARW